MDMLQGYNRNPLQGNGKSPGNRASATGIEGLRYLLDNSDIMSEFVQDVFDEVSEEDDEIALNHEASLLMSTLREPFQSALADIDASPTLMMRLECRLSRLLNLKSLITPSVLLYLIMQGRDSLIPVKNSAVAVLSNRFMIASAFSLALLLCWFISTKNTSLVENQVTEALALSPSSSPVVVEIPEELNEEYKRVKDPKNHVADAQALKPSSSSRTSGSGLKEENRKARVASWPEANRMKKARVLSSSARHEQESSPMKRPPVEKMIAGGTLAGGFNRRVSLVNSGLSSKRMQNSVRSNSMMDPDLRFSSAQSELDSIINQLRTTTHRRGLAGEMANLQNPICDRLECLIPKSINRKFSKDRYELSGGDGNRSGFITVSRKLR